MDKNAQVETCILLVRELVNDDDMAAIMDAFRHFHLIVIMGTVLLFLSLCFYETGGQKQKDRPYT